MGFFDFLFDLDGDGKVETDEAFISIKMTKEIEIEIAGDEEAFKTLKDAFQTELGTPFYEDSVSAIWKVNTDNGIKVHSLLYDVGEPQIYLNYYPNKG